MKKQFYFATWLRTAAMISILLCHFVAQSKNALLNMSAQFFNIGVDLFIIYRDFFLGRTGEKLMLEHGIKKDLSASLFHMRFL